MAKCARPGGGVALGEWGEGRALKNADRRAAISHQSAVKPTWNARSRSLGAATCISPGADASVRGGMTWRHGVTAVEVGKTAGVVDATGRPHTTTSAERGGLMTPMTQQPPPPGCARVHIIAPRSPMNSHRRWHGQIQAKSSTLESRQANQEKRSRDGLRTRVSSNQSLSPGAYS